MPLGQVVTLSKEEARVMKDLLGRLYELGYSVRIQSEEKSLLLTPEVLDTGKIDLNVV